MNIIQRLTSAALGATAIFCSTPVQAQPIDPQAVMNHPAFINTLAHLQNSFVYDSQTDYINSNVSGAAVKVDQIRQIQQDLRLEGDRRAVDAIDIAFGVIVQCDEHVQFWNDLVDRRSNDVHDGSDFAQQLKGCEALGLLNTTHGMFF